MTEAALPLSKLRTIFGTRLRENEPLARLTSARIGGPADLLLEVNSADELSETVTHLWKLELPFQMLGGGSNMLISDLGIRGIVILNKARSVKFDTESEQPTVWAESGANFGVIARQAAQKNLSGLEWAAGIPGTLGGAVYGNAGAHGSDIAMHLKLAEVLHTYTGREKWTLTDLKYSYRSSVLKENLGQGIVLAATLNLQHSQGEAIQQKMDEYLQFRRRTQPPGATIGSMFKNPPDDYAGRLLEESGLKGLRVGNAGISELHANFFVNHGEATAAEVYALIQQARAIVLEKFDIDLTLEVELIGEWKD